MVDIWKHHGYNVVEVRCGDDVEVKVVRERKVAGEAAFIVENCGAEAGCG